MGIPDKKYGEIVGCFIKFEEEQVLNSADLKDFIRQKSRLKKHLLFGLKSMNGLLQDPEK